MRLLLVPAEEKEAVTVAHHALPLLLKQAFQLREILQNNGGGNLSGAHDGQNLFKIVRQTDIGKFIH